MTNKYTKISLLSFLIFFQGVAFSQENEGGFWENVKELGDQLTITKSQFLKTLEALEEDIENLTDEEKLNLIFLSSVSTKEKVSDI